MTTLVRISREGELPGPPRLIRVSIWHKGVEDLEKAHQDYHTLLHPGAHLDYHVHDSNSITIEELPFGVAGDAS